MNRIDCCALLAIGTILLSGSAGWAAANATLTETFNFVDPSCDQPNYTLSGTVDFTSDDDGFGNDWLALVYHDGSGNYHDVDFLAVQGVAQGILSLDDFLTFLPFARFLGSRPLVVRVHDIGDPGAVFENAKEGIEFATPAPVIFELAVDPGADAGACLGKPVADPALRIESLRNGVGQSVTTSTALNLDGAGTTSLTFAVPVDAMMVALFRAECANDAASDNAWADITILVDGVALSPTAGSSDAFCTSNGSAGLDQWVMARTGGARLVSGPAVHSVQVMGQSVNGGTSGLFDTELLVVLPEPRGWALRGAALAGLALLARRRARPHRAARRTAVAVALGALALAVPGPAVRADTVLLHTSNNANQTFLQSAGPVLLNLGSGTSFNFVLARATRLAIVFSAECAVDAADSTTWLDLNLRVDGVAVPESDQTDDAFCTSTGATPGITDNWVSAGHFVTIDLPAGVHNIEVEGQLQSGVPADAWWIGNLSLSVIGQEH